MILPSKYRDITSGIFKSQGFLVRRHRKPNNYRSLGIFADNHNNFPI